MNLFVNAEVATAVVEAFEDTKASASFKQCEKLEHALEKLADAMIVTIQPSHEALPVAKQDGKPLGDETMPTEARLIARLEAACRVIDSFNVYSIFSVRFVAEQQRFIQELRGKI